MVFEGLTHAALVDVDAMLESPAGERVILMSDADCADNGFVNDIDITFSDDAAAPIPQYGSIPSNAAYNYRPADYDVATGEGEANCPGGFNAGVLRH